MNYTIREAVPDDVEDIFEIELESFINPWIIENYINEFKIPFSYMIVAEVEKKIIGFALVWFVNDEAHLNKIAVTGRLRKHGIASLLIDNIIQKSKEKGIKIILLEVRERNKAARKFYRKLGFVENGLRKKYYPDDNAVLIEKVL